MRKSYLMVVKASPLQEQMVISHCILLGIIDLLLASNFAVSFSVGSWLNILCSVLEKVEGYIFLFLERFPFGILVI